MPRKRPILFTEDMLVDVCNNTMWLLFKMPPNVLFTSHLSSTDSIHLSAMDHDWSRPKPPTLKHTMQEIARMAYEKGYNDGANAALNRIRADLKLPPLS